MKVCGSIISKMKADISMRRLLPETEFSFSSESVPQIHNVDYDWLKLPNELFENNGAHGAA
jgi:hypothetical protein